jgi:hypothetical protein
MLKKEDIKYIQKDKGLYTIVNKFAIRIGRHANQKL